MKGKSPMSISIDSEKAFDKIQDPFMIKTLSKVEIEETYLNVIKVIYNKTTDSIILNGQNLQVFPVRSGLPFTPLTQHSTGSLSYSNQMGRRNKRHPSWEE